MLDKSDKRCHTSSFCLEFVFPTRYLLGAFRRGSSPRYCVPRYVLIDTGVVLDVDSMSLKIKSAARHPAAAKLNNHPRWAVSASNTGVNSVVNLSKQYKQEQTVVYEACTICSHAACASRFDATEHHAWA